MSVILFTCYNYYSLVTTISFQLGKCICLVQFCCLANLIWTDLDMGWGKNYCFINDNNNLYLINIIHCGYSIVFSLETHFYQINSHKQLLLDKDLSLLPGFDFLYMQTWKTSKKINNYQYHGRFRTVSFLLLYFNLLMLPAEGTVTGKMELVLASCD